MAIVPKAGMIISIKTGSSKTHYKLLTGTLPNYWSIQAVNGKFIGHIYENWWEPGVLEIAFVSQITVIQESDPIKDIPVEIKAEKPFNHQYLTLMAQIKEREGYIEPVAKKTCSHGDACKVCRPSKKEPFVSNVCDFDLLKDA